MFQNPNSVLSKIPRGTWVWVNANCTQDTLTNSQATINFRSTVTRMNLRNFEQERFCKDATFQNTPKEYNIQHELISSFKSHCLPTYFYVHTDCLRTKFKSTWESPPVFTEKPWSQWTRIRIMSFHAHAR